MRFHPVASRSVLLVALAPSALSQFGPPQELTEQVQRGRDIFAEDIDGGGITDLLWAAEPFVWYEGLASGGFGERHVVVDVQPNRPYAAADVDGDSDVDILHREGFDQVHWLENLGSGVFGTSQPLGTLVTTFSSISVVDLDLDGVDDTPLVPCRPPATSPGFAGSVASHSTRRPCS